MKSEPMRSSAPARSSLLRTSRRTFARPKRTPLAASSPARDSSISAPVMSTVIDRASIHNEPFDVRVACDKLHYPFLEVSRIEEHDPGAESVDHKAGMGGGLLVVSHVVPSSHPRHTAQHGIRRSRGALDQQEQRAPHCQENALQQIQPDNPERSEQGQDALRSVHTPHLAQRSNIE